MCSTIPSPPWIPSPPPISEADTSPYFDTPQFRRWPCWERLERAILLREYPLLQLITPSVLRPDFTWRHRRLGERPLSKTIPPSSTPTPPWFRRAIGYLHHFLSDFSRYYCAWFGFPYCHAMAPLPFGLLLKWSDGTSIDEAQSMRAIRAAGIPAPKIISYGEHSSTPWAPISILMTRLPGNELADVYETLDPEPRENITKELKTILEAMRSWVSPWGARICSISGGSIRSIRVPNHRVGPCETERELHDYLIGAASDSFDTREEFQEAMATAEKIHTLRHRIVYTHGDLAMHNILVHDGRVSGFIDWESAGWYPCYWEFTTPLRWTSQTPEWRDLLMRLGGDRYQAELESELAIRSLTVDAWIM